MSARIPAVNTHGPGIASEVSIRAAAKSPERAAAFCSGIFIAELLTTEASSSKGVRALPAGALKARVERAATARHMQ